MSLPTFKCFLVFLFLHLIFSRKCVFQHCFVLLHSIIYVIESPIPSLHEWDPSVLDYSHPEGDEEPVWACD